MNYPIEIDDMVLTVEEFSNADEKVLRINDRYYRIHKLQDQEDQWYYMLKVGRHTHTVRGTHEHIAAIIARVHKIYRDYDGQIRQATDKARRNRERSLNRLLESR